MSSTGANDRGAVLTRAAAAETLGADPNTTRLLADADDTGGSMNAVRTTLGRGVDGPPPHYHANSPELFFVLGGSLQVLTGEEVVSVGEGDFLLVPPYMAHAWGTGPETGADVLIIKAPGDNRFEYFRLVDRIRKGEASPQEILATQDRFDNHFVDSRIWRETRAKTVGGTAEHLVAMPSGESGSPADRERP
ncbi:cupin domain-containing protein [Streptosporangium subroseum]|uniref:cupin domain-containing protein n=1 Tax=Streptosporangium subroseum TaxID=106412 RepID=UPI0030861D29|nr:cupin domain-containing protein [Streptosporangium subroseum]